MVVEQMEKEMKRRSFSFGEREGDRGQIELQNVQDPIAIGCDPTKDEAC